jgi:hypothetical protein
MSSKSFDTKASSGYASKIKNQKSKIVGNGFTKTKKLSTISFEISFQISDFKIKLHNDKNSFSAENQPWYGN